MSILNNFDEWKSFLNTQIDQAQKVGVNDETIANIAYQMANYLSNNVDPKNKEDRLLKGLWENADTEQQKTLASILVNYMDKKPHE